MVNVLIPTMPNDAHAIYVHLALKKLGHKSTLWYTADFPSQQTHFFEIKNGDVVWEAAGVDLAIRDEIFDVVWVRRPRKPMLPESLHPDDKKNALEENMLFFQTLWHMIAPRARWINPFQNISRANCKLAQLKAALQVGLQIPKTVISNDPAKIKQFIQDDRGGDVIYKTLSQFAWLSEKETRLVYTKKIKLSDLPSDEILQSTPGIFQKRIPKAFELRVTMMGDYPVAVKLHSQDHPKGIMDWRYIPTHELVVERFELPLAIKEKCIVLMKKMNLVFGCFDFIVTPDNEYYFLEVNEQGQFLWIEQLNPEIKMLDSFVNFLIDPSSMSSYQESPSSLSIVDFSAEVSKREKAVKEKHKDPGVF